MTRRRPRLARAVAAVVGLLLVAGCGGLSTHTSVEDGLDVGSGNAPQVRVLPPPPVAGADPEQILRGFIRAGSASEGAYDNARLFLTDAMRKAWDPDAGIVIFTDESSIAVHTTGRATAVLTGAVEATVAADGRYTTLPATAQRSATVGFARVDGEWRIAELPKGFGRWIADADVARLLRPYAVHFVAVDRRALVADVRWFPLDHLTTRLARAQLEAVPDYLRDAVRTEVPQGARLLADGVPVVAGTATVDLSAAIPADRTVREGLWAQFVSTLTQVPGVTAVSLQVAGASLDLPGVVGPVTSGADLGFEPQAPLAGAKALVRRGDALAVLETGAGLDGRAPKPSPTTSAYPQIPASVTNLALSLDGRQVAGVDPGRASLSLWTDDEHSQATGLGGALGDPSFDRLGYLWVGAVGSKRSPATRLWALDLGERSGARGAAYPIAADWLAHRRVVESKVAPDGQRLVVLSTDAEGADARLDLAGIVRGAGGRPSRLAAPLEVSATVTGVQGLAWLDNESLTTLGGKDPTTLRPYVVGLGGDIRALTRTPGAISVASPAGERAILVVTLKGEVLARSGSRWVAIADGTDVLVAGR